MENKLNSGIIQWGRAYNHSNNNVTIKFPITFSKVYVVVTNGGIAAICNANSQFDSFSQPISIGNSSFVYGFRNVNGANWCQYIVIGS